MEHKNASSSERKRKKDSRSSSKEPSGSKKSESSKDKDDKHGNVRNRHYAYISPETITKIAESIGIPSLNDDIAVNLAEDVSYKLQEIIHTSCTFMRCCKRRRLLTSDVRSALQTCDAPPVYGQDGDDNTKFVFVPEAEVYVPEEAEVDLISSALSNETYTQRKPPNISTSWPILINTQKNEPQGSSDKSTDSKSVFAVPHPKASVNGDGTVVKQEFTSGKSTTHASGISLKTSIHSPTSSSSKAQNELVYNRDRSPSVESTKSGKKVPSGGSLISQQNASKANGGVYIANNDLQSSTSSGLRSDINVSVRHPEPSDDPHVSATQLSYFKIASDCILRGSDTHFEVVLADLRTNDKLGMLVPYFLNLVAFTINRIPRHFALLKRLLSTVDALLHNQTVNPSYSISVNRVVNALLAVTSDHRILDDVNDFQLRQTAAHLLARVFAEWNVEDEHVSGLLSQLSLVLGDSSEPVQSHYGALVIFQALGYPVTSDYLGHILHKYLPRLQAMIDQCPPNNHRLAQHLQEIRGVILIAAETLYSGYQENTSHSFDSSKAAKDHELDRLLYEHFGDALCARRRHFPVREKVFNEVRTLESDTAVGDTQTLTESELSADRRLHLAKARLSRMKSTPPVPNTKRRTRNNDVFEATLYHPIARRKEINFTFAGANPVPKERLRRRLLDRTHAQCAQHVRSPAHTFHQSQSFVMGKQRRGRNAHLYSVGSRVNQTDVNNVLRQL